MSNAESAKTTAQEEHSQQEWETMARAWLSSFPEVKEVTAPEVEAWIDSNLSSLPTTLRSMPRPDLCLRLLSIQNIIRLPTPHTQGSEQPVKDTSSKAAQKDVVMEHQAPLPSGSAAASSANKLPKNSDEYLAKRNEAYRKYQLLVELEKRLPKTFMKKDPKKN